MKILLRVWVVAITLFLIAPIAAIHADEVDDAVLDLQHAWAAANYQTGKDQKETVFEALAAKASSVSKQYPNRAEPKIWEAIIRAGYAGVKGGLGALSLMKEARDLMFTAEKIKPEAMEGAIYTSLGSFYYMVPGWPIGFGDDDKALEYLKKGLAIAPNNMDANYFMGDYWLDQDEYKKALPYFEKVLSLPDVATRPVYSKARKANAQKKLDQANNKLHR